MKNQTQQVTAASLGVGVGIGIAGFQPSLLLPPAGGVCSAAGQETGDPRRAVSLEAHPQPAGWATGGLLGTVTWMVSGKGDSHLDGSVAAGAAGSRKTIQSRSIEKVTEDIDEKGTEDIDGIR